MVVSLICAVHGGTNRTNIPCRLEQVGVCGLGLMGHGIVQIAAMVSSPGNTVVAVETNQEAVEAGQKKIDQSLSKMLSKRVKNGSLTAADAEDRKAEIVARISYASSRDALYNCDIVIEAITENPEIKLPFYEELGRITRPDCILASNTSSLSIMVRKPCCPWYGIDRQLRCLC